MDRPINLTELKAAWKRRDALYAGLGMETDPDTGGVIMQDAKARPGALTTTEIAAIKLGRMREVEINLEPGERARGWALVKTWVGPLPYGTSPLADWLQ